MKSFYLTTPIYYVNDAPHIGTAYTTVAGDVLTRWHRQRGESVWFLTGTDEHGQKVLSAAESNGVAPQDWCDTLVTDSWIPVWKNLNIANDDFIRTTEPRHTHTHIHTPSIVITINTPYSIIQSKASNSSKTINT